MQRVAPKSGGVGEPNKTHILPGRGCGWRGEGAPGPLRDKQNTNNHRENPRLGSLCESDTVLSAP